MFQIGCHRIEVAARCAAAPPPRRPCRPRCTSTPQRCERVGGALLQSMRLTRAMFGARAMVAVRVRLAKMKLKELAEELGARGATKSGQKRALQLRLLYIAL